MDKENQIYTDEFYQSFIKVAIEMGSSTEEIQGMVDEIEKSAEPHPFLPRLREAKNLSDGKNYKAKAFMLRGLILQRPHEFFIDSPGRYPGVTHKPTKFRFHLPHCEIPVRLKTAAVMTPVESSNLKAVGYNKRKKDLDIEFRSGGKYRYPNTDKEIYKSLLTAPSKGKYFHQNIRARADFQKLANDLKPYQRRTLKRIQDPNQSGLVIAHGTGTGKTRQSIEIYKKLGLPTNVVVPAALRANYQKELDKWVGHQPSNLHIDSQQAVARKGLMHDRPGGLLVVDEAHRARSGQSSLMAALRDSQAKKRVALTATPVFNHPTDMSQLVNFVAKKNVLPTDKKDFERRYINNVEVKPNIIQRMMGVRGGVVPQLKNTNEFKKILNQYVDYYPGSEEGFPSVKEQEIKVPLGKNQMDIYKAIMGQAPLWVRWKVKAGLPPDKGEIEALRAFLGGARQVSNTTQGFVKDPKQVESVKIQKAFEYLNQQLQANPRYKAVVYSNYINSGLNPYKQLLEKNKVPYGEFTGELSPKVRNELVKQYNASKLRALLISSAGSEGLDLKGTRLVQILEPHFNEEKEKQIIGRGSRYMSHAALPQDEQNMLVQRYLAGPQPTMLDRVMGRKQVRGVDEYIRNIALQKSLLTRQVQDLLNEQNRDLHKYSATKGEVADVLNGPDMLALEPGLFTKKNPKHIATLRQFTKQLGSTNWISKPFTLKKSSIEKIEMPRIDTPRIDKNLRIANPRTTKPNISKPAKIDRPADPKYPDIKNPPPIEAPSITPPPPITPPSVSMPALALPPGGEAPFAKLDQQTSK